MSLGCTYSKDFAIFGVDVCPYFCRIKGQGWTEDTGICSHCMLLNVKFSNASFVASCTISGFCSRNCRHVLGKYSRYGYLGPCGKAEKTSRRRRRRSSPGLKDTTRSVKFGDLFRRFLECK